MINPFWRRSPDLCLPVTYHKKSNYSKNKAHLTSMHRSRTRTKKNNTKNLSFTCKRIIEVCYRKINKLPFLLYRLPLYR